MKRKQYVEEAKKYGYTEAQIESILSSIDEILRKTGTKEEDLDYSLFALFVQQHHERY